MEVLIFSDIHIHPHSGSSDKLENCLDCLKWIYQQAEKKDIKHIIFAGDLFHDRHRINIYAYQKVYDILSEYTGKIESYYLVGNHDMFYKSSWSVTSTKPLNGVVNVITEPSKIKIGDTYMDFLPYTENPIEEIENNFKKKSKILISHLAVQGATLNTLWGIKKDDFEEDIEEVGTDVFSGYKKVFLGHYHAKQKLKGVPVEYIGSPLQLSFGEAMDKKGFSILDTKTLKTKFVENTFSPKYFILPENEDFDKYGIDGGYVKVIVSNMNKTDLLDTKRKLRDQYNLKSI